MSRYVKSWDKAVLDALTQKTLDGGWTRLHALWDATAGRYDFLMEVPGSGEWIPCNDASVNVTTIRYVGGPKDGVVES